jgi:hypothetical protein
LLLKHLTSAQAAAISQTSERTAMITLLGNLSVLALHMEKLVFQENYKFSNVREGYHGEKHSS